MPITIQESLGAIERSVREGNDEFRRQFKDAETMLASQAETLKALEARVVSTEEAVKARKIHSVPGSEAVPFNWGPACRGVAFGIWDGAEQEREMMTRAQSQGDDTKGGYLVPIQHMVEPIEALTAKARVLAAGATPILGLSGGNLEIPKLSGTATLSPQTTEGTALGATDYTFGQVVIAEKTVGGIVLVSEKVLRNSPLALNKFIPEQLFKDAARKADYYALRGTGSSGEPFGVINTAGINTVEAGDPDGGNFTNETALDMESKIEDDDALPDDGGLKLIWHPLVKNVLKRQRILNFSGQTAGMGYLFPGVSNAKLAEFLGYEHFGSTQLRKTNTKGAGTALGDAILADWSQLIWAVWGNPEVKVSDQYKWAEDQIALKIVFRLGFGVRHPEAFCLVDDARTVYA